MAGLSQDAKISVTPQTRRQLVWTGLAATVGAFLVGIGEFTFQYSPRGGYEGHDYLYFIDVSHARLTIGHFLGVLVAPIYMVGYWHVARMLQPAGRLHAALVFGLGVYAFAIGNVWLGGRVNLALVVQSRENASAEQQEMLGNLLQDISAHNEPLINIVRVLVLVISIVSALAIWSGKAHYPKWSIAFLPIVLLVAIFTTYAIVPTIGLWLLPAAMNIAHFIFFGISSWVAFNLLAEPVR